MDLVVAAKYLGRLLAILGWMQAMLLMLLWIKDYGKPNRTLEIYMIAISVGILLCSILSASLFKYADTALDNPVEDNAETAEEEGSQSTREFYQNTQIVRLAVLSQVFPPLKSFKSNTAESIDDPCVVCLEEFKNGELVQPFPKCNHEFHASCINSWLFCGKVTCPVCRLSLRDLLIVEVETTSRVDVNAV